MTSNYPALPKPGHPLASKKPRAIQSRVWFENRIEAPCPSGQKTSEEKAHLAGP